jgi:hypothetical protein
MAQTFLVPIDLTGLELRNFIVQVLASDPTPYGEGHTYYNSTLHAVRLYANGAWKTISTTGGTVAGVTGTSPIVVDNTDPANPIVTIQAASGSQNGYLSSGDWSLIHTATSAATANALMQRDASGRAKVADPAASDDIATKGYADALINGFTVKAAARLATTAALATNSYSSGVLTASANGALSVDGVAVAVGDRLIVKNEATGKNNGVYTVTATGDSTHPYVLTRAVDFDASAEIKSGDLVNVSEGTTNGGSAWYVSTTGTITLDTTAIAWTELAGKMTAGNGISLSGVTITAVAGDSSITVDSGGIKVTSPKLKFSANVGDGSSTSIAVTHSLGTRDVEVQVYRNSSPWETVYCDVERTDTNNVTVKFAVAPATNAYRVVVLG